MTNVQFSGIQIIKPYPFIRDFQMLLGGVVLLGLVVIWATTPNEVRYTMRVVYGLNPIMYFIKIVGFPLICGILAFLLSYFKQKQHGLIEVLPDKLIIRNLDEISENEIEHTQLQHLLLENSLFSDQIKVRCIVKHQNEEIIFLASPIIVQQLVDWKNREVI